VVIRPKRDRGDRRGRGDRTMQVVPWPAVVALAIHQNSLSTDRA
jgi:hypothetical protein